MFRPRLRIPRAPRLGGLARTSSNPSPFLRAAAAVAPSPSGSRSMHAVPELDHLSTRDNDSWLLSEIGFTIAWREYQSLMLHKLNAMTAGTDFETAEIKSILLATARDPEFAHFFNYASTAHNNHFFFKQLSPTPTAMSTSLQTQLIQSFGSIETFRLEMINTANAMFGPGFVWLVQTNVPTKGVEYQIVPTYLAGSPYPAAHWRRQSVDLNTGVGSTEKGIKTARKYLEDTAVGQGRAPADADKHEMAPGGINLVPLLCLNTWEHVYLADFGVGGKLAFAEKWFNFVDWDKVESLAKIGSKAKISA